MDFLYSLSLFFPQINVLSVSKLRFKAIIVRTIPSSAMF